MYYVMRYDRELTDAAAIKKAPVIPDFSNPVFDNGTKIEQQLPIFDYFLEEDGQGTPTDYLWSPLPLVLSARFRDTLDSAGVANVDYYPVRILNRITGETREDYFQANIVGAVACMDEERSGVRYFSPPLPGRRPSILEITYLTLDPGKIGNHLLFRLERVRPICVAHQRVKDAVERARLTGVVFLPANGYVFP